MTGWLVRLTTATLAGMALTAGPAMSQTANVPQGWPGADPPPAERPEPKKPTPAKRPSASAKATADSVRRAPSPR
jgi:hypothetical protein